MRDSGIMNLAGRLSRANEHKKGQFFRVSSLSVITTEATQDHGADHFSRQSKQPTPVAAKPTQGEPRRMPLRGLCIPSLLSSFEHLSIFHYEIHIFQLGNPGVNSYRHLRMRTKGADLVLNLVTTSPYDSDLAPGCQYGISVGEWHKPLTALDVTIINSEDSDLRLYFRPLMRDSPWADTEGVLPLDLGTQQSFQARSVSIKSLDLGNPRTLLSAISNGPLLTIRDLKIGSEQIQLSIVGKGWVEIDGEPWTVNFLNSLMENKIPAALLAAANAALLALAARLIFKTSSTKPVKRGQSQ